MVVGDHNLFGTDRYEQTLEVSEIIMHPHYNRRNLMDNDVALLKLKRSTSSNNDGVSPHLLAGE